ncbi:uncharacterized protein LOC123689754 [Pieris rapae]|uniref:uncharacterized protein LOC123689754 n=1 Tax=Pieris rapae TaxID=64459 RepID=UPI001E27C6B6|nr:uncharacterized protein LOC123689754 [Pieris rapae]
MKHNPQFTPSFQTWESFEDLYATIQSKLQEIKNTSPEEKLDHPKLKLPPIKLPQFNGDPNNWTSFYEAFNHLVHNNGSISNSEKEKPFEPAIDGLRSNAQAIESQRESLLVDSTPRVASGSFDEPNNNHAPISLCSLQNEANTLISQPSTVLLGTARVCTLDTRGNPHILRCLIDNGSQNHFITTECCKKLLLNYNTFSEPMFVNGFGGCSNDIIGATNIVISSRYDKNIKYSINSLIVKRITDYLPTSKVDRSKLEYLFNIPLADDIFHEPGQIDMLIGAQLFSKLLKQGRIQGPPGMPDAVQTTFGFILMGEAPILSINSNIKSSSVLCAYSNIPLENILRRFWELEEPSSKSSAFLSEEEEECERIYKTTTYRELSGRYVVALPFKKSPLNLGSSMDIAKKRFMSLERKLQSSPSYREAYDKIFIEYLEKDYISPVVDQCDNIGYIIPHHGVIRESSISTKVRMVLDSSAKTDNNISINDILHVGPNLQPDLFAVILRFRTFPIAFCADVKQMYLQLKTLPEHNKYQRVYYRFDPSDPLQLFEFKRVCFGFSSSPYLALRTLKQLADDERAKYPLAADVIDRGNYYMDDICCSCDSIPEAFEVSSQLIKMFSAGGFDLLKWSSNSEKLLSSLPSHHLHPQAVHFDSNEFHKVLGVKWDSKSDTFSFEVSNLTNVTATKRNMLSIIARLWDVLGFAAPFILYVKLLIKELWLLKQDWDEIAPPHIIKAWKKFYSDLPFLSNLQVPRHVGVTKTSSPILLAFCDASEKAYGAVIYLCVQSEGNNTIRILYSKSKISPLKVVSLARLELCAAHLMAKLLSAVTRAFEKQFSVQRVVAMSDSTIVLNWINSSPHRLKTFVANRVTKIQEVLSPKNFYHISGKTNPADCLSRGLTASQLISHGLWLNGPSWAVLNVNQWPLEPFILCASDEIPERKVVALPTISIPQDEGILEIVNRISDWSRCLRVCTYIFRFIGKLKSRGKISPQDLQETEIIILRAVQKKHFHFLTQSLLLNKSYPVALRKLSPFIVNDVIRVGGRLSNTDLTFDHKHPIILPHKDHVVNLIIDWMHKKSCHAGPQHLISLLRQRFWILSARRIVRSRVYQCIKCFKLRPRAATAPIMADLPKCRLSISKPFTHVGVDFGGPLLYTPIRRRGSKSEKIYICVFICLVTRAIHIETATDLSTNSFLNALKRFMSRRGPIQVIYSDNGTNFIGARSYLSELQNFIFSNAFSEDFRCVLNENRITWQMIPPNAPHFGGSWEAAIKSVKTHLFRVIGKQLLSYEEFLTVLSQIEAILNSRPLGILSEDPSDPSPLTPAHFLNLKPLNYLLSSNIEEERMQLLSRYHLLDKLIQSYWKRWSNEYLHTLQTREKWNSASYPIKEGVIVLLMEKNAPSLHWPLGIVEKTYPGKDDRTRVALIRTKSGTFKRPIIRLCPLPILS